jgi:uncharacterized protein (TIGR04255 family)
VETALSVQFNPIEGLGNAHFGLFWSRLRQEFPQASEAEPLPPQFELFGDSLMKRPRVPTFRVVPAEGASRTQLVSADGHEMIQVQNGRLVYNWRRQSNGQYPRWHQIAPRFRWAMRELKSFLEAEGLPTIQPNQWEVTYVNHLLRGQDWHSARDWPALVPGVIGSPELQMMTSEYVECNWRLALPDKRGRLHIELFQGYLGQDSASQELLVLQLTARGGIDKNTDDISIGLEMGHESIVRSFAGVTGPDAHIKWGRTQ